MFFIPLTLIHMQQTTSEYIESVKFSFLQNIYSMGSGTAAIEIEWNQQTGKYSLSEW